MGESCSFLVKNLTPHTEYSFSLCLETPENGERSQASESTSARTLEWMPSAPQNLKLLAATTSQIKVSWEPPATPNGILSGYHVYCNDILIEQTNELQSLISGLHPSTLFEVSVCASTSRGKLSVQTHLILIANILK